MLRLTGYAKFYPQLLGRKKKGEVSENIINISSLIARPKNLTRLSDKNKLYCVFIGVMSSIV